MFTTITTHKKRKPAQRFAVAANTQLSRVNMKIKNLKSWAIFDSGATSHLLITDAPVTKLQLTEAPLNVRLPDSAYLSKVNTYLLAQPPTTTDRGTKILHHHRTGLPLPHFDCAVV